MRPSRAGCTASAGTSPARSSTALLADRQPAASARRTVIRTGATAGVITLRPDGTPVASTTPAQQWLDILATEAFGGDNPQLALHSAAVSARFRAPGRTACLHMPTPVGWVCVRAAADLHADQVTIVVQHARLEAMIPILATAYGLTGSERAVLALVMRGCHLGKSAITS